MTDYIPDIPDDYLTEIGRVTFRWSILETILTLCLSRLSGFLAEGEIDVRLLAIFTHMSFPQKLDTLGSLVELTEKDLRAKPNFPGLATYPQALEALKVAQQKRNSVAHGTWGVENGIMLLGSVRARGKVKVSDQPVTVRGLRKTSDDILIAVSRLLDLISSAPHSGQ